MGAIYGLVPLEVFDCQDLIESCKNNGYCGLENFANSYVAYVQKNIEAGCKDIISVTDDEKIDESEQRMAEKEKFLAEGKAKLKERRQVMLELNLIKAEKKLAKHNERERELIINQQVEEILKAIKDKRQASKAYESTRKIMESEYEPTELDLFAVEHLRSI